ncbi:MAG: YqaA family protein [Thermodesulfobacteriota bacterium]
MERVNPVRKIYDWVLKWAETPYGVPALALLAFSESCFFPIPPDVLLIAMAISVPKKALKYALICSVFSVLGGMAGYLIGWGMWELVGDFFLKYVFSPLEHNIDRGRELFQIVQLKYQTNAFFAIFTAAFTPIPYKIFTIAAGVFGVKFFTLVTASAIGRSMRFFIVAGLIYFLGPSIKGFIDKYFNILTIVFTIILVVGFLAVYMI